MKKIWRLKNCRLRNLESAAGVNNRVKALAPEDTQNEKCCADAASEEIYKNYFDEPVSDVKQRN